MIIAFLIYLLSGLMPKPPAPAPLIPPPPSPFVSQIPTPPPDLKPKPTVKVQAVNTQSGQMIKQLPIIAITHSPVLESCADHPELCLISPQPTEKPKPKPTETPQPTLTPIPTLEPDPTLIPIPSPPIKISPIPVPSCPPWPVIDSRRDQADIFNPPVCLDALQ